MVYSTLSKAIRAVPVVKYAMGVAGIAAASSLISIFTGNSKAGLIVLAVTFVSMVLLFAFSRLAKSDSSSTRSASIFLLWSVVLFFVTFLTFTVTSFALGWPKNWVLFLGIQHERSELTEIEPEALSAIRDISKWICNEIKPNFEFDDSISRFKHDTFLVSHKSSKTDSGADVREISADGSDYSINFRYQISENGEKYGFQLQIWENFASSGQVFQREITKEVFVNQFGNTVENFSGGRSVQSKKLIAKGLDSPMASIEYWAGSAVIVVEWFQENGIGEIQKMCSRSTFI